LKTKFYHFSKKTLLNKITKTHLLRSETRLKRWLRHQ